MGAGGGAGGGLRGGHRAGGQQQGGHHPPRPRRDAPLHTGARSRRFARPRRLAPSPLRDFGRSCPREIETRSDSEQLRWMTLWTVMGGPAETKRRAFAPICRAVCRPLIKGAAQTTRTSRLGRRQGTARAHAETPTQHTHTHTHTHTHIERPPSESVHPSPLSESWSAGALPGSAGPDLFRVVRRRRPHRHVLRRPQPQVRALTKDSDRMRMTRTE